MKNFERRLKLYQKLKDSVDDYIWEIFNKYIKDFKINFNLPESWSCCGDSSIYFTGQDGCRGCYDSMSLEIPLKFFLDYETSLKQEKEKLESEKLEKELRKKGEIEKAEKELYKRLKKKYDNSFEK